MSINHDVGLLSIQWRARLDAAMHSNAKAGTDRSLTVFSVQCNTLHGTEYKITCGVCVRARRVYAVEYLENGYR